MLHARTYAPTAPPSLGTPPVPIVLVHGFTQTNVSWEPLAHRFASAGFAVICPDAPGHGGSGRYATDLWAGADLIAEVGGRAVYIGYSMGGRLALHLALEHPAFVTQLVLIGATAGIDSERERMDRLAADEALAKALERDGVARFITAWLAGPLFASFHPTEADVAARLANSAEGLATSLRLTGTGAQTPLWDRLGELGMPTLLIAGETDRKFRALADRMRDAIGSNATTAVIASAGHAAHLVQPDRFVRAVAGFLGPYE